MNIKNLCMLAVAHALDKNTCPSYGSGLDDGHAGGICKGITLGLCLTDVFDTHCCKFDRCLGSTVQNHDF